MQLNRLGNKPGIVGLILTALGLGTGNFSEQIAREFAPPAPYESYESRQTVQTLQEAVDRLAGVINHGETITTQIKENVEVIRKRANEATEQMLEEGVAQGQSVAEEAFAEVRTWIVGKATKTASILTGLIGMWLASAGFRKPNQSRDKPTQDQEAVG